MFKKRENVAEIEEGNLLSPKFDNDGLIPVITMCSKTKEVLIIENFKDNVSEEILYSLWNTAVQDNKFLIITSKKPINLYKFKLPDLKSRILSSIAVKIKKPNDQLLSSVLVKLFVDKQILIDKKIIKFIVYRSERSFANLENIVNKIDKQSLITKKK